MQLQAEQYNIMRVPYYYNIILYYYAATSRERHGRQA